MKERIENILRVEGISSSRFADEVGVQRSGISHILSGRNNPSLDLLQKILNRFRNINAEWLLTGKGSMHKNSLSNTEPTQLSPEIEPVMEFKSDDTPVYSTLNTGKIEQNQSNLPIINEKKIEKILVFFSDKTFEEYRS